MNSLKILIYIGITLLIFNSCKVEPLKQPLDTGGGPPEIISNVKVENLAGAAKLTYKLPDDSKLLYVKAECVINGKITEVKASSYVNELVMEGFGEAREYEVKLFSVSKSEKTSEPIIVKVNPTTPAYKLVYESLSINETFGGASVTFKNPTEANIVIEILAADEAGDWKVAETFYTKRSAGTITARGYASKSTKFGVHVKDRWDNRTDTLKKQLVPVFEKQIDRTKFQQVILPTDQLAAWGWTMPHLWDGIIVNNTDVDKPGFHTNPAPGQWPQWFTFSLGTKSKLSRFKFWQRGSFTAFTDRNIKKFEIWGSNDPATDGSWESWTKLMDCESIKPSGLPPGKTSAEDLALVGAGEEFVFPENTPSTKFIRIKVLQTWGGAESFYVMQVAFWGADDL
jgi:hypothetical protein